MINKITLIGRLGQDPQHSTLESGATVAKISVATDERYKDAQGEWQTKTEWVPVVAWRYLADKLKDQAKKGTLVYIEGKFTTRTYQKNDETRYTSEVVASVVQVMKDGIPRAGDMPSADDAPPTPAYTNRPQTQATAADTLGAAAGAGDGEEADLPF